MNRDIKFRVWDNSTKRWIKEWDDFAPLFIYQFNDKNLFRTFNLGRDKERFISQQFTGIKDKNNKEIYEGDILENKLYKNKFRVAWCNEDENFIEYCGFVTINLENKDRNLFLAKNFINCEIIGNIFENPELLNNVR